MTRLIDSAAMAEPCPQCGHPTNPGARFCGSCGYDLVSRPTIPTPEAAPTMDPKRTMLGMPVAQLAGAPAQPPGARGGPAAALAASPQRTMLGMPAVDLAVAAGAPSPAAAPAAFAPVLSARPSPPPVGAGPAYPLAASPSPVGPGGGARTFTEADASRTRWRARCSA
ncbi:MAG: zinc ribbon domain-containing protein [Polyangiales bacterium]